jgi:hypothetical protein
VLKCAHACRAQLCVVWCVCFRVCQKQRGRVTKRGSVRSSLMKGVGKRQRTGVKAGLLGLEWGPERGTSNGNGRERGQRVVGHGKKTAAALPIGAWRIRKRRQTDVGAFFVLLGSARAERGGGISVYDSRQANNPRREARGRDALFGGRVSAQGYRTKKGRAARPPLQHTVHKTKDTTTAEGARCGGRGLRVRAPGAAAGVAESRA